MHNTFMSSISGFFLAIWIAVSSLFMTSGSQPEATPSHTETVTNTAPLDVIYPSQVMHASLVITTRPTGFGTISGFFNARAGYTCASYTASNVATGSSIKIFGRTLATNPALIRSETECVFLTMACPRAVDVVITENGVEAATVTLPESCPHEEE